MAETVAILLLGGVGVVLVVAAMTREPDTTQPVNGADEVKTMAELQPRNDKQRRIARALKQQKENLLFESPVGLTDPNVRTNFGQIRVSGRNPPAIMPLIKAYGVARALASQNDWDSLMKVQQERVTAPQNYPVVNLNPLTPIAGWENYPFYKPERDARFQATKPRQGPIDTNRTLWLRDPYNLANPYMPASRTRPAPLVAFHNEPQTIEDVRYLLPKNKRGMFKPKRVRFAMAPSLSTM